MKKASKNILPVLLSLIIFNLVNCKKTFYQNYQLGWNGDHAYFLKVTGVWDRDTYYLDGKGDKIINLGKIPVSSFELRQQAEIFAQTRAVFAFQDAMRNEFIGVKNNSKNIKIQVADNLNNEKSNETDNVSDLEESVSNVNDLSITNNEKNTANQPTEVQVENSFIVKRSVNYSEIFDKVDLKISMVEKYYTPDDDVEVIYLFYGKNLKQELSQAFAVSEGAIELWK